MPIKSNDNPPPLWIEADLRLVGILDSRMIALLQAIDQNGSINQAAKQVGLSYKGAWQIIERANNGSPKMLVSTAIGGNKGGGTCLTDAGRAFIDLYSRLEQQHRLFLTELNATLAADADTQLLLQRLVVKTSARNQLFGNIIAIQLGAVNAEITVKLKGGEQVLVNIGLSSIESLGLRVGADALLLINNADILLTLDAHHQQFMLSNCLACRVIRIQQDEINAEVMVLLPGGEILAVLISPHSAQTMAIEPGQELWAVFSSNSPILGVKLMNFDDVRIPLKTASL